MSIEVLLLSYDSSFFNLKSFSVLKFDLCPFLQDHVDYLVEIFINLSHHFDFALFYILPQLVSLSN